MPRIFPYSEYKQERQNRIAERNARKNKTSDNSQEDTVFSTVTPLTDMMSAWSDIFDTDSSSSPLRGPKYSEYKRNAKKLFSQHKQKKIHLQNMEDEKAMSNKLSSVPENVIFTHCILSSHLLGRGANGAVYSGLYKPSGEKLAIKIERIHPGLKSRLYLEFKIYNHLWTNPVATNPKFEGYPRIVHFGQQNNKNFLILEHLGKSVSDLHKESDRRFSIKTVLMIGSQGLERLESLHTADLIHRDVKPSNMATGLEDKKTIYFFDLGLAHRYTIPGTGEHMPFKNESMRGTLPFMSMNAHENIALTRRDDLASLGFSLVYLCNGKLPWFGHSKIDDDKLGVKENSSLAGEKPFQYIKLLTAEEMAVVKRRTTVEALCEGMPRQMEEYFNLVRSLEYDEKPDYAQLHRLFEEALVEGGYTNDGKFDWIH